jgi:hypothetical protein
MNREQQESFVRSIHIALFCGWGIYGLITKEIIIPSTKGLTVFGGTSGIAASVGLITIGASFALSSRLLQFKGLPLNWLTLIGLGSFGYAFVLLGGNA